MRTHSTRPLTDSRHRGVWLAASLLAAVMLLGAVAGRAEPPRAAVFPFELDDTSLQGSREGANPQDQARRAMLDGQLRSLLEKSGRYAPVAIAADPAQPSLRTCDGCEVERARAAGAAVSVIGWVQKVSNLILNINLVVRDVATGRRIAAGSVDIRGDTDESWARGLSYLVRNWIRDASRRLDAAPGAPGVAANGAAD